MLPKPYRLKKRIAFNATYRTGHSLHKNGVTVFCGKKKNNTDDSNNQNSNSSDSTNNDQNNNKHHYSLSMVHT